MRRAEAYLRFAGDCLRKASHEHDRGKRSLFVLIATAWVELADRAKTAPPNGRGVQDQRQANTLQ
jgi:hypothetical protein